MARDQHVNDDDAQFRQIMSKRPVEITAADRDFFSWYTSQPQGDDKLARRLERAVELTHELEAVQPSLDARTSAWATAQIAASEDPAGVFLRLRAFQRVPAVAMDGDSAGEP